MASTKHVLIANKVTSISLLINLPLIFNIFNILHGLSKVELDQVSVVGLHL